MSSQSAKSLSNTTFKSDLSYIRDTGDYIKNKKARILYTELKNNNTTSLSIDQRQSYNLQLDYNLGSVVCNGCTGGANYPMLPIGQ
jgi:hypothetical protein